MKILISFLLASSLLASCTLRPRPGNGRTLSPDHEAANPDHWPQDTVPADSVAPSVH
ncbi:hypothetical protein [Hymenobacter pini]|uniref:hypothetical protein n=1 Tax=Hymenobacter pini TaxID=2880879 RepID=UPI001CF16C98|nr:hypothetical protein [Hymenobacter pini]MCA8829338.1 hypothetical protein [Hymenobacter pini]